MSSLSVCVNLKVFFKNEIKFYRLERVLCFHIIKTSSCDETQSYLQLLVLFAHSYQMEFVPAFCSPRLMYECTCLLSSVPISSCCVYLMAPFIDYILECPSHELSRNIPRIIQLSFIYIIHILGFG